MAGLAVGDPYRYVDKNGNARRYVVAELPKNQVGVAAVLDCLEPPLPPQEGHVGGKSGQARVLATSLSKGIEPGVGGWLPGHG